MNLETQQCRCCSKTLHVSMFNVAPRNTNGINRKCKVCMAESHRKKNPVPPPPIDIQGEEWREVEGYDGDYEISNYGRVKSYKKGVIKLLKIHYTKKGYPNVHVSELRGKDKLRTVHRLVALAFIPNPFNYPQVNHIDGIKTNNHISNLEWCDNTYNQRHAWQMGLGKVRLGEENNKTVLTHQQVIEIRKLYPEKSQKELCVLYGVSQSTVSSIIKRKTWNHI